VNTVVKTLKTIELCAAGYTSPELMPADTVSQFFTWVFDTNVFDCAVLAGKEHIFGSLDCPRVIVTTREARNRRGLLETAAHSGFELLIALKTELREVTELFEGFGYRTCGHGTFATHDEHDPKAAAHNNEALEEAVMVASRLSRHPLCLFAHDGDPVYLLYREDGLDHLRSV
jgi:hypothetical protein